MHRYKYFISTLIGYFLGNVFTKLISVILLPLYTTHIAPDVYGEFNVNMTLIQLIVPIAYVCIWNSIFRFSGEQESLNDKYRLVSNGMFVMCISTILCTSAIILIGLYWDIDNMLWICFYAVANGFQYFYGYVARSMRDNKTFIVSGCLNSAFNLITNWLGIVYFNMGIEILYFSYIFGTIVQVSIIEFRHHTLAHFKIEYVSKKVLLCMMKFSGPLAINGTMQWLLTGLTQIVIASVLGAYFNGLYAVAIKFATFISLIVSIFEYAWLELAYDIAKKSNSEQSYEKMLNVLFRVLMFGAALLNLIIKIVFPVFIGDAYIESLSVIPHVVIYACANAFASFTASIYMSYKSVKLITLSSLIAGCTNMFLLFILIPIRAFSGAMTALAVASIIMMLIRLWGLKTKFKITLNKNTIYFLLVLLVSIYVFNSYDKVAVNLAVIFIIFILFIITLINVYNKEIKIK